MKNPTPKACVVLFQLGGPSSLEEVEPFLYKLFCDPFIISLPGAWLFRKLLASFISTKRAKPVQELYKRIGGSSPILAQTKLQAESLQASLAQSNIAADVLIAMRYSEPSIEAAVSQIISSKYEQIILLPLFPHYCKATTGSSLHEWTRIVKQLKAKIPPEKLIHSYPGEELYIKALVEHINLSINRMGLTNLNFAEHGIKPHLVFSAHGTPISLVKQGDPYANQIQLTYELVVQQGQFNLPHSLCFQSKVGPQKWLEPSLHQTITRLAGEKITHLIVVPLAFVCENLETISEINIEARQFALSQGISYFEMMPALTVNKNFITCLTNLVKKELEA